MIKEIPNWTADYDPYLLVVVPENSLPDVHLLLHHRVLEQLNPEVAPAQWYIALGTGARTYG